MQLHRDGVRGSSYANVLSVCKGRTKPNHEFVAAAATYLGVSMEWLSVGTGSRSNAEALAERSRAKSTAEQWKVPERLTLAAEDAERHQAKLKRAFLGCFVLGQAIPDAAWGAAATPWYLCLRRHRAANGASTGSATEEELARRLGKAFELPLKALGADLRHLSGWQIRQYANHVAAALEIALINPTDLAIPVKVFKVGGKAGTR